MGDAEDHQILAGDRLRKGVVALAVGKPLADHFGERHPQPLGQLLAKFGGGLVGHQNDIFLVRHGPPSAPIN